MTPNDMTAQEAADWCAEQDGWERTGCWGYWYKPASGERCRRYKYSHPHPLTLDGAAGALPEGLYVSVNHFCDSIRTDVDLWEAATVKNGAYIAGTGPDELTARYRLAVACRMAVKESNQ